MKHSICDYILTLEAVFFTVLSQFPPTSFKTTRGKNEQHVIINHPYSGGLKHWSLEGQTKEERSQIKKQLLLSPLLTNTLNHVN